MRVMIDLAPDAPRWATAGTAPDQRPTVNRSPDRASSRLRRRGRAALLRRLPGPAASRMVLDLERAQPLHVPQAGPPRAGDLPRDGGRGRATDPGRERDGAKVLAGETAAVGDPGTVTGPREFVQRWLCLDTIFVPRPAPRCCEARDFQPLDLDGFAHHPYGPAERVFRAKKDIVSLLVIRRLGDYLDSAARAGRVPANLPIYATEFGLQSNPPDPTVGNSPARQAARLNEKEELSFRYPRLESYSQYLMYDDPPRPGATQEEIWSGSRPACASPTGRRSRLTPPTGCRSWSRAHRRRRRVWGRVRPGRACATCGSSGARAAAIAPRAPWSRPMTPATSRPAGRSAAPTATGPSTPAPRTPA